jgi:2,4-dienoyl-CoA reductase-like NADH-dependent reductase (Old Yellow Enzyme family)
VTRAVRDALPAHVPVFAAGRVWNAQDAAAARAAGADVVAVAKAAIGEPSWAARVGEPGFEPLRPPFRRDHLASVDVAPVFADYLAGFPGMVEGGAPRRPQ